MDNMKCYPPFGVYKMSFGADSIMESSSFVETQSHSFTFLSLPQSVPYRACSGLSQEKLIASPPTYCNRVPSFASALVPSDGILSFVGKHHRL